MCSGGPPHKCPTAPTPLKQNVWEADVGLQRFWEAPEAPERYLGGPPLEASEASGGLGVFWEAPGKPLEGPWDLDP